MITPNTNAKRWFAIIGVILTALLAALSVISQATWPASWQGPVLTVAATITGLLTTIQRIWQSVIPLFETTAAKAQRVRRTKAQIAAAQAQIKTAKESINV